MPPRFSIVTPSFRQLGWLKLCAASIADQTGVTFEHIVQDAGTGPELEAWAATQPGLQLFVEKDHGMYDAVNRGLRRATGEIVAYLNCDEQYLPCALAEVARFLNQHPDANRGGGALSFGRCARKLPASNFDDLLSSYGLAPENLRRHSQLQWHSHDS